MRKIFKHILKQEATQEIRLSGDTRVLSVQVQDGKICMWTLEETDFPIDFETKIISIYGTGENVPWAGMLDHLGTVQLGAFVFHVFMGR